MPDQLINKKDLRRALTDLQKEYQQEVVEHQLTKAHLSRVINSPTFKAGRIVAYIPRVIVGFIRRHRDISELRRVLKHVYYYSNQHKDIKVAIIARNATRFPTSSAFLRLISPLTYGQAGKEVSLKLLPENTTQLDSNIDVCIVQRTAFNNLEMAKMFAKDIKNKTIKLIVDTDDAFAQIEETHPEYATQYNLIEVLKYIKDAADRVWVSVDALNKEYSAKRSVYRNSVDKRLWKLRKTPILNSDQKISAIYMGTTTHKDDFDMILPALDRINSEYDDAIELSIAGVTSSLPERPWLKAITPKQRTRLYPNFVQWFRRQGPFDIGLAPLVNTDFNKAKSDIKVLDYLCLGVLPVVSDLEPYKSVELDDFVIRVGYGPDDWYGAFKNIINHKAEYARQKQDNFHKLETFIYVQRSVEVVSQNMLREIKGLLGQKENNKI